MKINIDKRIKLMYDLYHITEMTTVAGFINFINVFAERLKLESPFDTTATGIIRAFLFAQISSLKLFVLDSLLWVDEKSDIIPREGQGVFARDGLFLLLDCDATARPYGPSLFFNQPACDIQRVLSSKGYHRKEKDNNVQN